MHKKYATYLTEDFIQDDYFVQWVNTPDLQSNHFWKEFLDKYPEQQDQLIHARSLIHNLSKASKTEVPGTDKSEIWEDIIQKIALTESPPKLSKNSWFRWAAAACFTVMATALIYQIAATRSSIPGFTLGLGEKTAVATNIETIRNNEQHPKEYQLPDQSKIILEPGSQIQFIGNFEGPARQLTLSGEAFFEVTKNPEKPFIVIANQLVTKVLGTSFSVKAREESHNITVEVKTGKVTVFTANKDQTKDPETQGMILRPNQKVEYNKSEEKMTRSLVRDPAPQVTTTSNEIFEFHDAPIPTILESMKQIYQIEILYDKDMLGGCLLNTSLTDETLFQKLDVICEAINATYKVVDGEIIISGKKCI